MQLLETVSLFTFQYVMQNGKWGVMFLWLHTSELLFIQLSFLHSYSLQLGYVNTTPEDCDT